MTIFMAHNTGTPHLPHEGTGFLLLVAVIAAVMLAALWWSGKTKQTDSLTEDKE